MPRRVEITSCSQCPFLTKQDHDIPFCSKTQKVLEHEVFIEVDEDCSLEEVSIEGADKADHRNAIKHIYQILQPKGMNADTMHDANLFFNQYLKEISEK